jgi:hypothetical protein
MSKIVCPLEIIGIHKNSNKGEPDENNKREIYHEYDGVQSDYSTLTLVNEIWHKLFFFVHSTPLSHSEIGRSQGKIDKIIAFVMNDSCLDDV